MIEKSLSQCTLYMSRVHDKTGGGRACNFHSILYVWAEYLLRTINRHFRSRTCALFRNLEPRVSRV